MTSATTSPESLTEAALRSFDGCPDQRLRTVVQALVRHLHDFVVEVGLTPDEWQQAIDALVATGRICCEGRNEFVLWSDTLGISSLVDMLAHPATEGATESTVLGPFWAPEAPWREFGESIAERPAGDPAWVHGRVVDTAGAPVARAIVDVWQNGDDSFYAVQVADGPPGHLRGRFRTEADGTYAFLGVRPTPYRIPDDGPVGWLLRATGREAWRPGHIHVMVTADGFRPLVTHIFDAESDHLDSDPVFAVKPSLLRTFTPHSADDPSTPVGVSTDWYDVEHDVVLSRES
jgi:catechol 1,2-dioxygenase